MIQVAQRPEAFNLSIGFPVGINAVDPISQQRLNSHYFHDVVHRYLQEFLQIWKYHYLKQL